MIRPCVALLTAFYAIGFAFVAMAAMRWPSLIAIGLVFTDGSSPLVEVQNLADWREIGAVYGASNFMAALCFYASSTLVQRGGHGAVCTFILGIGCGFGPLVALDLSTVSLHAPGPVEAAVLFAGVFTVFLFAAVWGLRKRRTLHATNEASEEDGALVLVEPRSEPAPLIAKPAVRKPKMPIHSKPVPPAIARQRASFAAYGRKARVRRNRSIVLG